MSALAVTFSQFQLVTEPDSSSYVVGYMTVNGVNKEIRIPYANVQALATAVQQAQSAATLATNKASAADTSATASATSATNAATSASSAAASDASAAGHEAGAATSASNAMSAAEFVGAYPLKSDMETAMASQPNGKSATVYADGLNDGYYVKESGAMVRKSTATLPTIAALIGPGSDPFSVVVKAVANILLLIGNDGEIYPSRLDGRSIQSAILGLEGSIAQKLANPGILTSSAPTSVASVPSAQMWRMDADGLLMLPHLGGAALQDYIKTSVEAISKTNTADGIALRIFLSSALAIYMRSNDGGLMIPGLGIYSVQEAIANAQAAANAASKLTFDARTFTLGSSTKATLVRDPADPNYSTGILYVAIPSVAKTGNRLWAAYTANKSVSVNSGEEPGSFCVLRYSDDGGSNWATAMYVAPPNPAVGRTADPTLLVRDGVLYLYYFQSGSGIAYDEAISTWQIACTNPQADPLRTIWSEPTRVQYGFFVTTQFRWNERYVMPLVVIPDALANANVSKQHLNIERGTHLYQVFGRSMTRIASIPFDLPASNRSWGETSVQPCPDGSLLALIRYADGLYFQRSTDGGKTWGAKSLITGASGIDATTSSKGSLTITDRGRLCLVWNNSTASSRTAMTIALSSDGGATWPVKQLIDGRDKVSYPNVAHDGDTIHVVYDRDRMAVKRIYHTALSEAALVAGTQVVTLHPVNND